MKSLVLICAALLGRAQVWPNCDVFSDTISSTSFVAASSTAGDARSAQSPNTQLKFSNHCLDDAVLVEITTNGSYPYAWISVNYYNRVDQSSPLIIGMYCLSAAGGVLELLMASSNGESHSTIVECLPPPSSFTIDQNPIGVNPTGQANQGGMIFSDAVLTVGLNLYWYDVEVLSDGRYDAEAIQSNCTEVAAQCWAHHPLNLRQYPDYQRSGGVIPPPENCCSLFEDIRGMPRYKVYDFGDKTYTRFGMVPSPVDSASVLWISQFGVVMFEEADLTGVTPEIPSAAVEQFVAGYWMDYTALGLVGGLINGTRTTTQFSDFVLPNGQNFTFQISWDNVMGDFQIMPEICDEDMASVANAVSGWQFGSNFENFEGLSYGRDLLLYRHLSYTTSPLTPSFTIQPTTATVTSIWAIYDIGWNNVGNELGPTPQGEVQISLDSVPIASKLVPVHYN